jgi:cbb3-type cytochrome oxidase subunit 3
MIQNVLRNLGGIQGYGLVSLCLFFGLFSCALAWALTRRKQDLEAMARLPLEDGEQSGKERNSHE